MTYDAADKYVVLFGGTNGTRLADTWTFNGAWTQLSPAASPPARNASMMAYDSTDRYAVLFGGIGATGTLSDTWKFTHGTWTHLAPATSPPALSKAGMVWDSTDHYVVLFGGLTSTGVASAGTYSFVAGTWTVQTPLTSPTARVSPDLGFIDQNGWVVLFGGKTTSGTAFGDTWNFTHGHWTQQHPATSPPASSSGAFTNDTTDSLSVLFGGLDGTGHALGATWTFVNGTWAKLAPATPPSARSGASATFDKATGKVVLFGGQRASTFLGDLWTYKSGVWFHPITTGPATRAIGQMTYDEADGYVLLFSGAVIHGIGLTSLVSDTWTYSHGHWTMLRPATSPLGRIGGMITYDAADGYVVLFGGEVGIRGGVLSNDTWTFLAGKWTALNPAVSPTARDASGFVYDAADGYVVLFGGYGVEPGTSYQNTLNDTWLFQAGTWSQWISAACQTCSPNPPGRYLVGMVYDAIDGYVVMFGGANYSTPNSSVRTFLNDTWVFSGGSWSNITSTAGAAPPPRASGAFVYDSATGYALLYGGQTSNGTAIFDTWSFSGGAWSPLFPAHNPGPDFYAMASFDPVGQHVLYLAGLSATGTTWLY